MLPRRLLDFARSYTGHGCVYSGDSQWRAHKLVCYDCSMSVMVCRVADSVASQYCLHGSQLRRCRWKNRPFLINNWQSPWLRAGWGCQSDGITEFSIIHRYDRRTPRCVLDLTSSVRGIPRLFCSRPSDNPVLPETLTHSCYMVSYSNDR